MTETVGFVGIGDQGGPIAMRILQGGFPLTVWARRPEAMEEFRQAGATCATSLGDLGSSCGMVGVCVTTDDDVRSVALGPKGLLASMRPGSTLAVHSTVHPNTVREVHAAGADRQVSVVDAPVSGGSINARAGTMAVILGGATDAIDRWRPVFATFATSVEVLGDVGAGQLAKLVNNAVSAITLSASLHALDAAVELGLDREAAYRVMTASSGDSFMLRRALQISGQSAGFAASRLRKDLLLLQEVTTAASTNATALSGAAAAAVSHLERLGSGQKG